MKIDKAFLEETIIACQKEKESLRTKFDRQEGVISFCKYLLENSDFEGKKEGNDGNNA